MKVVFFFELVEDHLKKQSKDSLQEGVMGTIELFPEHAKNLAVDFIDRWNMIALNNKNLWSYNTSKVFCNVIEDAKNVFCKNNIQYDDEMLFNMFQIVVMSYAYSASINPRLRKAMGISDRKKILYFMWLIPLTIGIYIFGTSGFSVNTVFGFIGWVMFFYGIGVFTGGQKKAGLIICVIGIIIAALAMNFFNYAGNLY